MKSSIRKSLAAAALTGGLLFAGVGVAATPANAAPTSTQGPVQPRATVAPATIDQVVTDTTGALTGTLQGTFTPTQFVAQNGQLVALGTFTGTFTNAATGAVSQVTDTTVSALVQNATTSGSCQILDLVIQPIDLDLLGLQVSLDTVHLNITAQQGPGNLLGNLLCSVTGLLDNNGGLNGLANLLNNLLRL